MGKRRKPGSWNRFKRIYIESRRHEDGSFYCDYCGINIIKGVHPPEEDTLTIDHIKPLSKGGKLKCYDNLAVCCQKCNVNKGDDDWTEKEKYWSYLTISYPK